MILTASGNETWVAGKCIIEFGDFPIHGKIKKKYISHVPITTNQLFSSVIFLLKPPFIREFPIALVDYQRVPVVLMGIMGSTQ